LKVKISHYVYENINFSIFFALFAEKENAHSAGIMLDAITLCQTLCQHHVPNLKYKEH